MTWRNGRDHSNFRDDERISNSVKLINEWVGTIIKQQIEAHVYNSKIRAETQKMRANVDDV